MGYHMNDFAGRVARYRQELAELTDLHDAAVEALEKFKGSNGYQPELDKLNANWKRELDALRAEHRPLLVAPLAAMRAEVEKRMGDLVVPDQRQLVMLQILNMKSTVSRSELDRAAASMQGCPLALSVLDDLAVKHGHHGCHYNDAPNPDAVLQQLDQMERNVGYFLSAERHNAKRIPSTFETVGQNDSLDDIKRAQLTRDFQTAEDCCRVFGTIPTDKVGEFESLVEIQA